MTTKLVPISSMPVSASTPTLSSSKAAKIERFRQGPQKPAIEFDKNELRKRLTPLQFRVTQEKHTERAFSGEYLKTNDKGKFCCVVCNEELFSSETKFDSGCGWPAFSNVIDNNKIIAQADLSHVGGNLLLLALRNDLARTEVICAKCGAHLGHVFDDGPKPTGKRYCVNSASLKFKTESSACDYSPNGTCQMSPTATALICQRLVQQERQQQQHQLPNSDPQQQANNSTTTIKPTVSSIQGSNQVSTNKTPVAQPPATKTSSQSLFVSPTSQPKPKLRFVKRSASAAAPTSRKHSQSVSQTTTPTILDDTMIFTTKPQNRVSRLMARFSCSSKKDKFPPNDFNNNPKDEPILISVHHNKASQVPSQRPAPPFVEPPKPEVKIPAPSSAITANRNLRAKFLESDL